jgi:hypothetical protein
MIAWLIEVGSPSTYYCGPGDWCSNPNHAHKFSSEQEAQATAAPMGKLVGGLPRCCEHMWDDAAPPAAQPPDAKPVYWDPPSDWLKDHEIPPMGSALQKLGSRLADMLQDDDWNNIEQMLFDVARECAAPQPPAGKGEPSLDHSTARAALAGMQVAVNTGDAIPREIHERLIRDAKLEGFREAFREAARRFDNASNEVFSRHDVAQELEGMADTMASEHKRGRE